MDRRQAGTRRTVVAIEKLQPRERNYPDGYVTAWIPYVSTFAEVIPAAGAVTIAGATQGATITHRVRLDRHAAPDLLAEDRLAIRSTVPAAPLTGQGGAATRYLYIRGIRDEDDRGVTWILECEELAPGGVRFQSTQETPLPPRPDPIP